MNKLILPPISEEDIFKRFGLSAQPLSPDELPDYLKGGWTEDELRPMAPLEVWCLYDEAGELIDYYLVDPALDDIAQNAPQTP